MESVPRLRMLWFPSKTSMEGTSFNGLKRYIAEFYQENPDNYSKELYTLKTLRNEALHTPNDNCEILKRYFCQLESLLNHFPKLRDDTVIKFTWKDLYKNNITVYSDIGYEQAAVLFNIAAAHTQAGAAVNRTNVVGMKSASTHFQCSAWAFGEIRERYINMDSFGDCFTTELLVFMQQVSLAQAQECMLEKMIIDNCKPNIVAKVTAQIVVYYRAALSSLLTGGDNGPVSQVVDSSVYNQWQKYVGFKISYLNSIRYLYQGQRAEKQGKMGERVTLFEAAWLKLEEARKESRGLPEQKDINVSLNFTAAVIDAKRKKAIRENESIYHESVPKLATISAVQGANLVNPISFSVTDPEVAGEDIFARLVLMKAHDSNSLYSEERSKLVHIFDCELEKHEKLSELIEQNLLDQENILKALTETYTKAYPVLKTLPDVKHKRESFLAASCYVYEDLLAKLAKGLEFYNKLSVNVQKLLSRCKSARGGQYEELQQRLKSESPKPVIAFVPTDHNYNVQNPSSLSNNANSSLLREFLMAKTEAKHKFIAMGAPNASYNAYSTQSIPLVRPNPLGSESPPQLVPVSNVTRSTATVEFNEPPPLCGKNIKKREKTRGWLDMRMKFSQINLVKEFQLHYPTDFVKYMRMDTTVYQEILNLVGPKITKQSGRVRNPITANERLACTLRFLATGNSFCDLQFTYAISETTVGKIVMETCEEIIKALKNYIKLPTKEEEWKKEAARFERRWNFPHCVGAIGGKHVAIKKPPHSGACYYNDKNFHSIVMMAVVNANCEFLMVDAGINGKIPDDGVFANTDFGKAFSEGGLNLPKPKPLPLTDNNKDMPYVFVGDDVFMTSKNLMAHFSGEELSTEQQTFNERLSRARCVVEDAFGRLVSRFRVLQTTIALSPEKAATVVLTCCSLHNLLTKKSNESIQQPIANDSLFESVLEPTTATATTISSSSEDSTSAVLIRDEYCRYFSNEGQLTRQKEKLFA